VETGHITPRPGASERGAQEAARGIDLPRPVTIRTLREMAARGEAFACLTCYDATTARWLQRAGVHVLLVGDTAAEVILGFNRTIDMPLDVLLALTAAVKRGAPNCLVMGDMPFMSYHVDEASAMRNAGRFLTEGLADVVKLEVDATYAPLVEKMTRAGIPVCAHVGSRPQQAALSGGYSSAGRTAAEAQQIVRDAAALQQAGSVLLLIEAVPDEVTREVLHATAAPTNPPSRTSPATAATPGSLASPLVTPGTPLIGIGAGSECHGQVLVIQDLLGMSDRTPRFAEPVAQLGPAIQRAGAEWVARVRARRIGGRRYHMQQGEAQKLEHHPNEADKHS
jgi:3-methyl-2-oxobutanoate hydroxymethyltransferase